MTADHEGSAAPSVSRSIAGQDPSDREAVLAVLAAQVAAVQEKEVPRAAGDPGAGSAGPDGAPADDPTSSDLEQAAKAICLRLLTIAPRPRAGLEQALARRDIPADTAAKVLDRLTEVGLIDDVAYAAAFVRTKHRDRGLGRHALRNELRQRGVAEDAMAGAIGTVDAEAEQSRATELIKKRVDAALASGPVAARRRLLGLLARRGYAPEIAVPVVERVLADHVAGLSSWE